MDSQTVTRPVPVVQAEFRAIGTTNRILATDLTVLTEATAIAREHLDALDLEGVGLPAELEGKVAAALLAVHSRPPVLTPRPS